MKTNVRDDSLHPNTPQIRLRRRFLANAGSGIGALALLWLNQLNNAARGCSGPGNVNRNPHQISPRVKRIVWLFMHGGPSHIDLFDPKPELLKLSGQPIPPSFGMVTTRRLVANNPLLPPIKPFRPYGNSGLEFSDFLPEIASHADDLCVIRSLHGDSVNHPQSVYQMNTGNVLMGHPSVGSWIAYGLGTENENLPAFIVLPDPGGGLKGGPAAWGNGFLPAAYQGVTMRPGSSPILDMSPSAPFNRLSQRPTLDLIEQLNRKHLQARDEDDELTARVHAYELAFRMQSTAPELVDLSAETTETHALYGLDRPETREFGQRCLLARRMLERGVRFVQLYSGNTEGWDAHTDVLENHTKMCKATDRPVAALLKDLKRTGLWNDTLVIWGGEFGRMPMSEQGKGRDHNPWGYSVWLSGGAVRGGTAYGETDALGLRATHNPVHIRNLHATILSLLGLDSNELSFPHRGLDERLTGPEPVSVVDGVIA